MDSRPLPFVSIVVPVRNEEKTIRACLEALLGQDYPRDRFEVIVVDNGSTDRTRELVREFPVRYLFEKKSDAGRARNRGAQAARGAFLAFTDGDCIVPPHWTFRLTQALHETGADAAGGFCRQFRGKSLLEHYVASRNLSWQKEFFSSALSWLPWLMTGNVMVRKSALFSIGGFEEGLFPGEEQDFFWRLQLSGGKLHYLEDLTVSHDRSISFAGFLRKNLRAGRTEFLLDLRCQSLVRSRHKPTGIRTKAKSILLEDRSTPFSLRLLHLFFGIAGYFVFRAGKLLARISYVFLKRPVQVPRLPKEFGENQLLYFASHPQQNGIPRRRLAYLTSKIQDWDQFLNKASGHRLLPRLYFFLKRHGAPSFLKSEVWGKIVAAHWFAQAYLLAHEAELLTLLPRFNQAGIDLLLMKGAALGLTVYKDKPVRFAVDLDLLIHPEDFSRTDKLLRELGYQPKFPTFPSNWHVQEVGLLPDEAAFLYQHPEKGTQVDLHLDPFDSWSPVRLEPDWLWKGAEEVSIAGSRALAPHPNRLFLHLLLHLMKDREMGRNIFGEYLDLDACLRYYRDQIDGHFLWETLRGTSLADKALEVLAFLEEHFHSPLPGKLQILLEKNSVHPLPAQEIFSPSPSRREKSELGKFFRPDWMDPRRRFFSYWGRLSGVRKKFLFLWHWFFPDRRYLETKYPCQTLFEKTLAYAKHFTTMVLKGFLLGLYPLERLFINLLARRGAKV